MIFTVVNAFLLLSVQSLKLEMGSAAHILTFTSGDSLYCMGGAISTTTSTLPAGFRDGLRLHAQHEVFQHKWATLTIKISAETS